MLLLKYALLAGAVVLVPTVAIILPAVRAVGAGQDRPSEADGKQGEPDGETDQQAVTNLLQRYCFACHAAAAQEANLRLDTLDLSVSKSSDSAMQRAVLNAIDSGQMPPEDADQPSEDERRLLSSWLSRRLLRAAEEARRSGEWAANRRLNVEEYNATMQDLFGVDADFAESIPADPISQRGYRNDRTLLGLSALQIECYLESARQAVERYVQFGRSDAQPLRYHIELEDLYYTTADRYGTRKQAPQPAAPEEFLARRSANRHSVPQYAGPLSPVPPGVFPTREDLRAAIPKLHQQFIAIPRWVSSGEMIVRVRAAATADRNGRFPRMRIESGITLGDGCSLDTRLLGEIDVKAPLDKPEVYEFRIRCEDVPTKGLLHDADVYDKLSVFDLNQVFVANASRDKHAIYALGRGGHPRSDATTAQVEAELSKMSEAGVNFLYLDCIEIEMLPGPASGGDYEWALDAALSGQGENEQHAAAAEFLGRFMHRAYRRPVSAGEVAQKLELFSALRQRDYSFEESLRETLTAVLVSPQFLFLDPGPVRGEHSPSETQDAYKMASRLSYLLWLAPPDARLMELADDGSLLRPDVLAGQVQRLLDDPRWRRFADSFCRQWLGLDRHRQVAVNAEFYPQYDDDLAAASIEETLRSFAAVFASDSSALELIDADYAFVNDRLADHYELDPVGEGSFRRVPLPAGSVRGGLLTQASLLTMNSDGVDSHPIRRGVWLLDKLLNAPPPPPPANVPNLDDEAVKFQGLSLKDKIALHREPGACRSCHQKIDPWGIALEQFDAIGRWREEVFAGAPGSSRAAAVDAAVQLPGGQKIDGIRELKRYLYEQRAEQFARAFVHHLLTYALGRLPDDADQPEVDLIYNRFTASNYRLKELVQAIVASEAFRL